MDEIGRGTSTFDGLSLAWACGLYLAQKVKAFTLFATHYFELTALPESADNTVNVHLDATEHNDNIVFLHTIQEGPASQSYGLQVAKLAGIPREVINLAKQQLEQLEAKNHLTESQKGSQHQNQKETVPQADFFANERNHELEERLKQIAPDDLSPKDALNLLYELKKLL
jgi:DNA mismatch repair protein MutS